MGLLDAFLNDDGTRLGLGLLAAGGPRTDGAGFGQRMMDAVGSFDAYKKQKMMQQLQDMQMQEMQQKMQKEKQIRDLLPKFQTPAQPGLAPLMGDAESGILPSAGIPAKPASFDFKGYADALAAVDPMQALQIHQLTKKENTPITVAPGASLVDPQTFKSVFTAPKEHATPAALQEYEFARGQGYNGSFQDWTLSQKRAGAPKMSVDLRDPTAVAKAAMSFQNDYRAATKASYARAQAYESMMQAANDPSPKGDLTMVYSFVKALDPESVVREGEIDLVNANRSVPDKVKGYARKLSTGQSLLPEERQDLIRQAQTLTLTDYKRSRNDVKAYRDNAQRLGLDADLYAPDPYAGFKPPEQSTGAKPSKLFNELPKSAPIGSRMRDTVTGNIMRFDGMKWKPE